MPHNSTNILRRGPLGSNVVERVYLIGKEVKGHACRYLETMGESINSAFHTWVVIERIAVEIAESRGVPF